MANYVQGIFDQSNLAYNVLVSGGTNYGNVSGMFIGNNTDTSLSGAAGIHMFQDLSGGNSYLDSRTANGELRIRYKDDTSKAITNMMVMKKDDLSGAAIGADVSGRLRATQFVINQADTRLPLNAGVYVGVDNSTVGYFRVNKGAAGTGGFKFGTYDQNGLIVPGSQLSLLANGMVNAALYTATGAAADSEAVAIAGFDADGNLIRNYASNARIRVVESRLTRLETDLSSIIPNKVNEIVNRLNGLNFFSNNIQPITVSYIAY